MGDDDQVDEPAALAIIEAATRGPTWNRRKINLDVMQLAYDESSAMCCAGCCLCECFRRSFWLGERRMPSGSAPLARASKRGSVRVVEALLAAGADVNHGSPTREYWYTHPDGSREKCLPTRGRTALSYACEWGHREVVVALLAAPGVETTAEDAMGKSPAHYAGETPHAGRTKKYPKGYAYISTNRPSSNVPAPRQPRVQQGTRDTIEALLEQAAARATEHKKDAPSDAPGPVTITIERGV